MQNISQHITYAEAIKSHTAVKYNKDNTPNAEQLAAMQLVAGKVFEPLREHFNKPIAVTSFFRSKIVNVLLGGASNSQHCLGQAIDIDADVLGGLTNADIFNYIKNNLEFDQLIWEFGNSNQPDWVHVSYKPTGNRKQILKAHKEGYKTVYSKF